MDAPSKFGLIVMGMPLQDGTSLTEAQQKLLRDAHLVIGESRKNTLATLRPLNRQLPDEQIFFLDQIKPDELKDLEVKLRKVGENKEVAVLFSDTGMPALFDPGAQIIALARKLKLPVRSVSGPTSWGTAAALSGFSPPFLVYGFLPRDEKDRRQSLQELHATRHAIVFLETPYRFRAFLSQLIQSFGEKREAFLAWEIDGDSQESLWGNLKTLENAAEKRNWTKGEFILILAPKTP